MKNKIFYLIAGGLSIFFLLSSGCAKSREPSDKIIARVNNDPIYVSDLKRELALKAKVDPLFKITSYTLENEVDNIINKRLLIQEAQKLKLDRTKRFVNTIKTFWEQTLIRDLVSAKNEEFKNGITVTEEEIRDYYNELRQKEPGSILPFEKIRSTIEEKIKEKKEIRAAREWLQDLRDKSKIEIDKKLLGTFGVKE